MALDELHKSFAVMGLSKFGYHAAMSLYEHGADVVVFDKDETLVQKIAPLVGKAVCTNVLDWDSMEHSGAFDVDVVIICLRESFEATVLLVNHLKSKTEIKKIIAMVDSEEKAEVLRIMGVHRVVFPEREMAERLVHRLTVPNLVNEIAVSPDSRIIEIDCPAAFVDKSLVDLEIRIKYKIYVISIVRLRPDGKPMTLIAPDPGIILKSTDKIVCLGSTKNLVQFTKDFSV